MKTLKTLMLMLLLVTGTSVFAEGQNDSPRDCMEGVNDRPINQGDTTVETETSGTNTDVEVEGE